MASKDKAQTSDRGANAAQPLGERSGLISKKQIKKTGKASQRAAGPDSPDANAVSRMTTGT